MAACRDHADARKVSHHLVVGAAAPPPERLAHDDCAGQLLPGLSTLMKLATFSPARVTLPSESFFDQFFNFFSKPAQNAPAAPTPAAPPSNGAWRSTCDASGVVSWYDFGVRLGG